MMNFSMLGTFLLLFISCAGPRIVNKTEASYSEKMIATQTLYEFGPTDYLRAEYSQNTKLTDSKINDLSHEMLKNKLFFAKTKTSPQGIVVARAGEEVEVVAKVFIHAVGDFSKIKANSGTYLVKDSEPQVLLTKIEYDQLQLKNVEKVESVNEKENAITNSKMTAIDYFNHTNEEDRLKKITWFCQKYPQFAKFQRYAINQKLTVGMPEHLLGLSWGQPARVAEEGNASGVYRSFYYPGNYQVITKNGIIHSWKKVE